MPDDEIQESSIPNSGLGGTLVQAQSFDNPTSVEPIVDNSIPDEEVLDRINTTPVEAMDSVPEERVINSPVEITAEPDEEFDDEMDAEVDEELEKELDELEIAYSQNSDELEPLEEFPEEELLQDKDHCNVISMMLYLIDQVGENNYLSKKVKADLTRNLVDSINSRIYILGFDTDMDEDD